MEGKNMQHADSTKDRPIGASQESARINKNAQGHARMRKILQGSERFREYGYSIDCTYPNL
jgi:hypothetical protein